MAIINFLMMAFNSHRCNLNSILDMKTVLSTRKYIQRIIKHVIEKYEAFVIDQAVFQVAEISKIHARAA